ncbi:aspartyl-phosphate phosphatase Spo0E family protein [Alteribacter keqinensis]|uniref:Aspartyl-phosphate phosphatase Spo0E family protein n=1 Tax=Alteribacter keqinensis TaxID=2483800 RepID=A0A3M7TU68_9BACI|nr:aspartyl-phosphate phosphatase Spo0E family protein [Alteribacter keqinensis]RNA68522.1 aspartyl-phosphate phosphatase Spo0E family protein [Alteribacter keqinensis]
MVLLHDLKRYVEDKRQLMMLSAKKNSLTSEETVRYSQELDELLNLYQQYTNSTKKSAGDAGFS